MTSPAPYKHSPAFDEGFLQVSELHKLHYEQYGKRDGKPVVFLHGGPGGSATYEHTVFFDPAVYRVILFDQRGAGKSLPPAELRENTSQLLVADIESLRQHCGIEKWAMVFGGSWGSTLSLLYAQTHPERVGSLVVRGVFTERKEELQFSRGRGTGAARIHPEVYERFAGHLDPAIRHDPIRGYYELLTSEDYGTRLEAAKRWNEWDSMLGLLVSKSDGLAGKSDTWFLQHARLETHYGVHGGFMEDGQLLRPENLARIKHIPCAIVQGRYDLFCPPTTAWQLHSGLPLSKLHIIPDAGHSAFEPGIYRKLIEVCDEFAKMDL
ncbi:proline iminopeptidase [Neohortaea acidophila]|uniref:Proline iminopeptidase n=1 Tax=Neohortaea acidophila TaxID=245834 RepID=A0A6A6PI67_9PEZI|nr:proline iminopeptidase [Neohortaea acidophila]KAF2479404.1 proline iminopeptidase [Neohortaea acidophila]